MKSLWLCVALLVSGSAAAQVEGGEARPPEGAHVVTEDAQANTHAPIVDAVPTTTDSASGALANTALMKATSTVQQLLQKTGELFTGLAGGSASTATQQAVYADVAAAFATQLASGSSLASSAGVVDSAVVASLVKAATQKLAASSTAGAAVKAAAGSVNADTLSQVAAGALKAQGEAILGASVATLTDITKTAQSDGAITSFVAANAATLAKPPGTDTATLAGTLSSQVGAVLAASPSRYLAIASDAITLANGSASKSYTMAQFQSDAGISVSWPLPSPMLLKVNVADIGDAVVASGQQLTAAVAITETTATGKGQLLGYVAKVGVAKNGTALQISLPAAGNDALVYGMSSDGKKQAVVDFSSSVANVANTLTTGVLNSIALGSVVNYGINQVSNDFTGIYSLRGKYKVTIVLNGLTLRKADGSALPALTVNVPTALGATGAVTASRSVSGVGLVGFLTLTD